MEPDGIWQSLTFLNSKNVPLLLMIEPIGEDYWVLPECSLTFMYLGEADSLQTVEGADFFGVQAESHMIALYPPYCYDWAIFDGDIKVDCGHNRPEGWGEELNEKYMERLKGLTEEDVISWFKEDEPDEK